MASSQTNLGKVHFFLGGGGVGGAGAYEGSVISESEHQRGEGGGVIPLCKLFKRRVTHLFQIFNEEFVTLLTVHLL